MPTNTDRQRIFKGKNVKIGGLSANIPLPNIVRIEILNKNARNRYLGTLQRITSDLRDDLAETFRAKRIDKFYGFMKGSAQRVIDLSSSWQPTGDTGGGIIGTIRQIVAGGTNNFKSTIGNLLELGRDLTGISLNTTGSSSIKRYNGSELNQFSIDCGWYLPEQYNVCVKSVKSIFRMAYPTQLDLDNPSQVLQAAQKIGTAVAGQVNAAAAPVIDSIISTSDQNKTQTETDTQLKNNGIVKPTNPTQQKNMDFQGIAEKAIGTIINPEIVKLFGKNLTFDPLPVRCSIGQFIDIEPLVISGVSIAFSNETFVNAEGRHLPIFVSVNIQFKFWMQPAPNLEFMQLLGEEIFGG